MNAMITLRELRKEFRVLRHRRGAWGAVQDLVSREAHVIAAVDGLTVEVQRGELVGLLGPNGAGKSTTLKMLTGILVPTSGEIRVNGRVPWRERRAHVARIGAVFGQRNTLWWDLPVIESLDLLQHIYRVPHARYRRNLEEFTNLLGMHEFLNTPVRSLSLGQLMRANLAAALLHEPDLLFLDEPTIGLDVVAKERIRQFIRQMNRERSTTVILTTQDLSDVEKLAGRVLIIDRGRLLYDGQLGELQTRFGEDRELVVDLAEDYPALEVRGARVIEREGLRVTLRFSRKEVTASELIGRLSAQYRIVDLSVREPEVEDTIRRIYEERLLE